MVLDGMGLSCHLYAKALSLIEAAQWLWLLGRWKSLMHHRGSSGGSFVVDKTFQPLELGPALKRRRNLFE